MKPRLLLLDEPFIGLDVAGRAGLARILSRLMRGGLQIIFMTARPWELQREFRRRFFLRDGKRAQQKSALAGRTGKSLPRISGRASRTTKSIVELRKITLTAGDVTILNDFSWTVHAGEHWAVVGPNGSGKTTLLSMLNGDHPQAFAQDVRLFGKPRGEYGLFELKAKIGWASPDIALHYDMQTSALDFICTGFFETLGLYHAASRLNKRAAQAWLDYFGLSAVANVPFRALSDGQQRLVLLARAMVKRRGLLILDEPCQGLDAWSRSRALAAIDSVCRRNRTTLIIVTHYADELPPCVTHRLEMHRNPD
jgi:molybdate transport system ATP-binding protein